MSDKKVFHHKGKNYAVPGSVVTPIAVCIVADDKMAEDFCGVDVWPTGIPLAKVNVSFGRTINLGNYESARLSVSVTRNCPDSDQYVNHYAKKTAEMVEALLGDVIDESLGDTQPSNQAEFDVGSFDWEQ